MFERVNTGGGKAGGYRALWRWFVGCAGWAAFAGCYLVPKPPAPAPAASALSPGPALADTAAEIQRLADEAEHAAANVTFPSSR